MHHWNSIDMFTGYWRHRTTPYAYRIAEHPIIPADGTHAHAWHALTETGADAAHKLIEDKRFVQCFGAI